MAIGDDATLAGFALVAGTDDRRDGYNQINKSRDYTAQVKATATAAAGAAAYAVSALAGKAELVHTHDDRYYPGSISDTRYYLREDVNYLLTGADQTRAPKADGPNAVAYGRGATGSGFYAVWMNNARQFMRNTSSRRYKKNIKTMTGCLDAVNSLRPVTYEAKDNTVPGTHVGLIAEEVAEVYPQIVPLEDGKPEAVNYEFLVAPLIGAVIELTARLEALEDAQRTN